jgi:aspartate/methionine/tyrosine aminotransferase
MSSRQMTEYLFSKGVLVRSGTEFDANGRKYFRISYATSMENLPVGMDRLKRALEELK